MALKRDNLVYLEVINKAINLIFDYIQGADEDAFLRNMMMKDACLMQLILIGENGGKISGELKDRFREVEWELMKAARNFFVHAYEYVDWRRVWDTINTVLPALKPKIEHITEVLEKENDAKIN